MSPYVSNLAPQTTNLPEDSDQGPEYSKYYKTHPKVDDSKSGLTEEDFKKLNEAEGKNTSPAPVGKSPNHLPPCTTDGKGDNQCRGPEPHVPYKVGDFIKQPKCLNDANDKNHDCKRVSDGGRDGRGGGNGGKGNWCDHHKCGDGGRGGGNGNNDGDGHHHHDHDKHYYNNVDKNYYYYYNYGYQNPNYNHATVILQLDYSHTSSYDEIGLVIGNDYYSVINFAGKPENLVVSNLDLYEGQPFTVCLENVHDTQKFNCVDTKIYDQDKAVYVDIRVP